MQLVAGCGLHSAAGCLLGTWLTCWSRVLRCRGFFDRTGSFVDVARIPSVCTSCQSDPLLSCPADMLEQERAPLGLLRLHLFTFMNSLPTTVCRYLVASQRASPWLRRLTCWSRGIHGITTSLLATAFRMPGLVHGQRIPRDAHFLPTCLGKDLHGLRWMKNYSRLLSVVCRSLAMLQSVESS